MSGVDSARRRFLRASTAYTLTSGLVKASLASSTTRAEASSTGTSSRGNAPSYPMMSADLAHSLEERCRAKPVLAAKLIDDKEMWIVASSRVALNLSNLAMPAHIRGHAAVPVELREQRARQRIHPKAGRFSRPVPAGTYTVSTAGTVWNLELIEGRHYELEFDPDHAVHMAFAAAVRPDDSSRALDLRGKGQHTIELRLFNAKADNSKQRIRLQPGRPAQLRW